MEQKHRNVLQTSFAYLIKNLHNVEDICDHLVSDDILTSGMMDTIKHKKPKPSGQTRELLSILPRRGKKAYDSFLKALSQEASANEEVADYLREKDGSKRTGKNSRNAGKLDDESKKPKGDDDDIEKTSTLHSENPDKTNKLESPNSDQGLKDWPDLKNRLKLVAKKEMQMCSEESYKKICEKKQVYNMTGPKKGKFLSISNVHLQCVNSPDNTQSKETENTQSKETESTLSKEKDNTQSKEKDNTKSGEKDNHQPEAKDAVSKCRSSVGCVDFDKTSIIQLFKLLPYESKGGDTTTDVSGDGMKQFLEPQLSKADNAIFDSLVIVIFSGGYGYKPGHVYDKEGKEVDTEVLFEMIRKSSAFKDKPKIVIIRTYDFNDETPVYDELDAEKAIKTNNDDLFVVSSQPKTKKGPWIIGEEMNGSYFIQALIHVFKKMAHEKSFLEMMKEVDNCLKFAVVAEQTKHHVAEVMILEQCEKKELFFFPGLLNKPAIHMKVPGWPDLTAGGKTVQKKDIKKCEIDFYEKKQKEKIYPMRSENRGKFILISNVQCIPCQEHQNEQDKKNAERCEEKYLTCIRNSDFDKSNMSQLLKYMGYDLKGGSQVKNLTKEEIKDFLKSKLMEIDSEASSQYDSLVILFLSGKIQCDATKIYDKNGDHLPKDEVLEIIKDCEHFKGKPKVIFVQTYSFQEESLDETDSEVQANDIIKKGEPNTDDIFVVSNYPRIEQGPWIIGENMIGSYFIQALAHVFKKSACRKSFMELLKEANECLSQAVIPILTDTGKNSGRVEKKTVAQMVLLKYSEEKGLYFFPGLEIPANDFKSVEPVDFSASMSGNLVTTASS